MSVSVTSVGLETGGDGGFAAGGAMITGCVGTVEREEYSSS